VSESSTSEWPEALELAESMVAETGASVRVVLLYGSRLLKARPDRYSALDFVVVVDDYRAFYSALDSAGELHRPVRIMVWLAGVLAPNVIAYAPNGGHDGIAKCLVISRAHFERALGPEPPDHFMLGRMVQRLGYLWSAAPEEERWARTQIEGAQVRILTWMAPYLEDPVDAERLGRRLLEVCYQGEFRPESRGRAGKIFESQAEHFQKVLHPALVEAVRSGAMRRVGATDGDSDRRVSHSEGDGDGGGDAFELVAEVAPAERRRWKRHFRRSKTRTTLRWLKHIVTFANWLPYVVRKAERHTGRTIRLTLLERTVPIIFLWPRAIYIITTRPRREIDS
jgi:hypothetical protein